MRKTIFLAVASLILFPVRCFSEQRIIPVVFSSDLDAYHNTFEGFRNFLDENKIELQLHKFNIDEDTSDAILSWIRENNPPFVFSVGTKASRFVKENVTDVPVVFAAVLDPTDLKGVNITGASMDIPVEINLAEIKKIFPGRRKLGVLYSTRTVHLYKEIQQSCEKANFQLTGMMIKDDKEFPAAVKKISRRVDFFLMVPDPDIYFPGSVEHLLLESLRNKFPVIGLSSFYTKSGALISFECDYGDLGYQSGAIALRLLNGERPADIGFSRPRKIKTSFNLITAERLNIKIPRVFIKEASEVFEE